MTRSQVRYLLGTPMMSDPFDPQRWDYIYTLQRGREQRRDRAHFIVHFEDDKVSRVEKPDLPEPARVVPGQTPAPTTADATREPPAPPSIKQPQPDAPRRAATATDRSGTGSRPGGTAAAFPALARGTGHAFPTLRARVVAQRTVDLDPVARA